MKLAEQIVHEDLRTIVENLNENVSKLAGKTVVITGGAGFLGNYLILTLVYLNRYRLKKPVKIVAIDNLLIGSRKSLLPEWEGEFELVQHDVTQPYKMRGQVDWVMHAAGIASPVYYYKYPLETIEAGTTGTKNFLELARQKKASGFMFFSSSEIYGNPDSEHVPTKETYWGNVSSVGPRSCYDESKRLGETLTMTYFRSYSLPVKIIRPFNVFGPGMKANDFRVIPAFLMSAIKGKPLEVHNGGKQTRTFCYVTDAVAAIYKVLLADKPGEIYNIGNDQNEIAMIKLAEMIANLFKDKAKIKLIGFPENYPQDDPRRRCPDLTKIKTDLNYEPKLDLETGIERLLAWFRSEYRL